MGKRLSRLLREQGHHVSWLTRRKNKSSDFQQYLWDWKEGTIEKSALEDNEVIVHLAGANLNGKRWNADYKKELYDSRIASSNFLWEVLSKNRNSIRTFISASGAGYYGNTTTNKVFSENDGAGNDFLAQLCFDWEASVRKFSELGIRTAILRTGVVLGEGSEAQKKMMLPIKYGLGAPLGSGNQYFSWIHAEDLCNLYYEAIINNAIQGVYNAVAPEFLTNEQLMSLLGAKINRPIWLPNIPSKIVQLIFGEIANSLLGGSRISCQKIIDHGFAFKYPKIADF